MGIMTPVGTALTEPLGTDEDLKDDQMASLFGDEDDAIFDDSDSEADDDSVGSVKVAREDIKVSCEWVDSVPVLSI